MGKRGIVLAPDDVLEIYRIKLHLQQAPVWRTYERVCLAKRRLCPLYGASSRVARRFGVSPKTVRDIWDRKTHTLLSARAEAEWHDPFHADWPFWTERDARLFYKLAESSAAAELVHSIDGRSHVSVP